mgnify:CR=1 FL=1
MSSIEFDPALGATTAPELRVNLANMRQTLDMIVARARRREGFTLFTVNLDHIVKIGSNRLFREAYERADFVTADGWPIVWIMQRDGYALERTAGADLLEPVCARAAEHAMPVYFVGPGAASQAAGIDVLRQRYPGLIVAGAEAPQLPAALDAASVEAIAQRLGASGARVCVLSLGAPKQELLADALRARCPDVGFLCVGAALDFISGHAARAPMLLRRARLEWFWRMINDPRRLTLRYAACALALFKLALPGLFRNNPHLRLAERN